MNHFIMLVLILILFLIPVVQKSCKAPAGHTKLQNPRPKKIEEIISAVKVSKLPARTGSSVRNNPWKGR